MKPYIHILAALAIWVFVVVLLGTEQNNTVMQRLDQVHTYALSKMPANYDNNGGARSLIINAFNARWNPYTDDAPFGCMTLLQWNATPNATCKANREGLVTDTRKAMNCDLYRSPACNCIHQVMKLVANDINVGNNGFTGTFATTATKSLAGQQGNMLAALDACHFLHHPAYLATETLSNGNAAYNGNQNTLIRRVGLLFVLSTMVTGNAVVYFLLPTGYTSGSESTMRLLGIIIWPIVAFSTVAGIEGSALNLLLYILLPPVIILIWYEWFSMSKHKVQFVHPFFFAVILATLAVIALIENEVLDYDNITFEIWKAHMISFVYFGVLWFTSKAQMHEKPTEFMSRAHQVVLQKGRGCCFKIRARGTPLTYTFFHPNAGNRHGVFRAGNPGVSHLGVGPVHVRSVLELPAVGAAALRAGVVPGPHVVQLCDPRQALPGARGPAAHLGAGPDHHDPGDDLLLARLFRDLPRHVGEDPDARSPGQRRVQLVAAHVLVVCAYVIHHGLGTAGETPENPNKACI